MWHCKFFFFDGVKRRAEVVEGQKKSREERRICNSFEGVVGVFLVCSTVFLEAVVVK